jgi:hypothetical protein
MKELEFGDRSGPKTVITLFAYGGVHSMATFCLVRDLQKAAFVAGRATRANETLTASGMPALASFWETRFAPAPQDALVGRARAVAAQRFLKETDADVLLTIDHDLAWCGPSADYEGDLLHLARQCAETRSIVGAAVSKKVLGQGIASMFKRQGEFPIGMQPALEEVWYLGGAFTAYHRDVLQKVYDASVDCAPGFRPIYLECIVPHPMAPKVKLHLSEDWAICHYARQLGCESYLSLRPLIVHYGEYGFQVVRDSVPQDGANAPAPAPPEPQQHYEAMRKSEPATAVAGPSAGVRPATTISLLHASRGRPELATAAIGLWRARAAHPEALEYIVSVDTDDPTMADWKAPEGVQVVCGESRGNVDAYNRAFAKSTGAVCLQVHDDLEPPPGWDDQVLAAIGDTSQPVALHVDDGCTCNPSKPWLMTLAIGTRAFFTRLGGLFYPAFTSLFCDDDMTQFAEKHGYRREAKHIKFVHHWGGPDRDETQQRSYSQRNWQEGERLFKQREAAGFPEVVAP